MSTIKRFLKDTIIYGIAAVLPRAINIILVKLHTNTLQTDKFAENTIYFVYAAYFNAILTYGMETAFFRFFTKEKEKGKVISTAFISLMLTTVLFCILMLYNSVELTKYFGFDKPLYLQILVLVTTFDTLIVIPYAYLRVSNRPIKFAFYKILNIFIYAFFNLYFLLFVPFAIKNGNYVPPFILNNFQDYSLVAYIFIASLIASFLTFILLLPYIFKFKITFDKKLLSKMLMYGLPIMVSGIAYVTNENLDKLLIGRYLGKNELGIYAACYKLGVFMTLYIMAFRLGAEPFFFNHAKEKNAKETYARILHWFTLTGTIFMLLIVLFIDDFAKLLLGKDIYFEALEIVPLILLANLFLGIYYNLSVWFKLTDKTSYGMYFSIISAIITIVFNIVFIPKIGYIASALATFFAYSSMTLASYYYGKKHYSIPYDIKKIATYIVLATSLSYLSFKYFRGNLAISFITLLAFIGFSYWKEKDEIKKILKR